jgi:hypothetical protein
LCFAVGVNDAARIGEPDAADGCRAPHIRQAVKRARQPLMNVRMPQYGLERWDDAAWAHEQATDAPRRIWYRG